MLWRNRYEPRVHRRIDLPSILGSRIVLAGFDVRAINEISLWLRLIESADMIAKVEIVLFDIPANDGNVRLLLPRSYHDRLSFSGDPEGRWRQLIEPDAPTRAFSIVAQGDVADILVVGPPTEEVWEEFERLAATP